MRCTAIGTRKDLTFPPVLDSRESPPASYLAWPEGWTDARFSKAWEGRLRRQTFLFSSHEEKWPLESPPYFPCCLSFKTAEGEMDAENRWCASKKYVPKHNLKLKRYWKGHFICTRLIKWLIWPKSAENHWSYDVSKWLSNWTKKSRDTNLRSPWNLLNLESKTKSSNNGKSSLLGE